MLTSENDFTRRSINTERTKKDEIRRRMGEVGCQTVHKKESGK
jgi:hypothetical protein